MARVTVEDCIKLVPNRFELVLLAAQRSRDIASGSEVKIERENEKNPVISLREIADKHVIPEELREEIITHMQKYSNPEDDDVTGDFQQLIGDSESEQTSSEDYKAPPKAANETDSVAAKDIDDEPSEDVKS